MYARPRVQKMLDHEYHLCEERLSRKQHPTKRYFAFANTVATINYHKTIEGHGWFGMRFQTGPNKKPNTVILHARFHEPDALLQHATIGILGVNLIYGCHFLYKQPNDLLLSLYDELDKGPHRDRHHPNEWAGLCRCRQPSALAAIGQARDDRCGHL